MTNQISKNKYVDDDRIIYTPSNFAKEYLLYIQELGSLQAIQQHTSNREHLDSYLFFMVNSGSGAFTYKNIKYNLNKGNCVFINCKNQYSHTTSKTNFWNLSWIHFYGNNITKIYEKYIEQGGKTIFNTKNLNEYRTCYNELRHLSKIKGNTNEMEINEKLYHLLSLLINETKNYSKQINENNKTKILNNVKYYLTTNYNKELSLDNLANMFFINKFYLLRLFKDQFGVTINDYILKVRITNAKYSLRFTDEPIKKIAIDCGFSSINYFSRAFKKIEGISPSIYKQLW